MCVLTIRKGKEKCVHPHCNGSSRRVGVGWGRGEPVGGCYMAVELVGWLVSLH